MSFEIQTRDVEGIIILELDGRLVLPGASTLRNHSTELLAKGVVNAILDFASVPFIDSTGLGILIAMHSDFTEANGALKLLNLPKRHLELLVLTKLSTVFEIFTDERAAIDSFFPDRARRSFDILDFVRSQEKEPES